MSTKKKDVKSRLVAPVQSIGRCGKSTLLQLVFQYLTESKVETSLIDCDDQHSTLQKWYPEIALMGFKRAGDLARLFEYAGESPSELIDFPAQATSEILEAFRAFQVERLFAEKGIALTIPIFASNEPAAMVSAAKIHAETKGFADYILVENPAKFASNLFDESKLATVMFKDAPRIRIPALSTHTVEAIQKKGVELRKSLTFADAVAVLPIAARMETQHWMARIFDQFNGFKELLTADPAAVRNDFRPVEESKPSKDVDFFEL